MKYCIRCGQATANDFRYPLSRESALSMSALGKREFARLEKEAKIAGSIVKPLDPIYTLLIAVE